MNLQIYEGKGRTISEQNKQLPPFQSPIDSANGKNYIASDALAKAVNVALALGQPLLLTGEPGTGKTRLAHSLAFELELDLLVFHTKSTSVATDLFYRYDSMAHFRAIQTQQGSTVKANNFINFEALGKAILLSSEDKKRSIVLIDEIDKAPRDFPNDLLHELEQYSFSIPELPDKRGFKAHPQSLPIVILTSNSEKGLPDAFLRRCVYFHIPFPDFDQLSQIVLSHYDYLPTNFVHKAVKHFEEIRKKNLKKPPATAELLNWLYVLKHLNINLDDPNPSDLKASYYTLVKTQDDLAKLIK